MEYHEISNQIASFRRQGKRCFVSSSFQTHSLPLLHILSRIDKTIPVLFLNTGFLFPETLQFRDKVLNEFGLELIEVRSHIPLIQQRDTEGRLYYTSDPDHCCYINKVQPMEPYLRDFDIWINGVRADQNANRKNLSVFEDAPFGCQRFHPLLDWSAKKIYAYIDQYNLSRHPLDDKGYVSIGCEPCTRKWDHNNGREGRWFGLNKTECGLHTDLVKP
jgi:phosphoadenosine phosphosulfate reductase